MLDETGARLDELDVRLIDLLSADARRSNVELARELGLTEGAVRKRIARLLRERCVRFTSVRNLRKFGYEIEVLIGVQVDQRRIQIVVQALRSLEPINSIMVTAGRYDLLVGACFKTREELETFLTLVLPNVSGISRTETHLVLSVAKRTSSWIDEGEQPSRNGVGSPTTNGAQPPYGAGAQQGWWRA